MSRKQRVLTGLSEIEAGLLKAAKTGSKKNVANLMRNLAITRDICQEGLSENSYVKYGEIYDGLIFAVEQMTKVKELRLNEEAFSLSMYLLQYLIRITEEETGFKKDIVFLPYKASMWDSLESVWKAAAEDEEHCNAYVIPIPYADLNPDRSVARWHCERDLFPDYVPTLDYKTFDLEALHPDVIFIHNPYDDCNLVTSVDPRFYSSELKKCTDKLVYVPYFVLGEPQLDYDDPEKKVETEKSEEEIAHFITTPGVLNADLTIVQSEAMKKVYVNVLNRHTNAPEGYWQEHILGLGSPKFDKVAESRKEDFQLPEEWERLIRGRKTILYNTGLTAMLKHTDKFLEKIKSVLETFKAQEDVVLWWRPHPLLRATFESMHSDLLGEYDEVVSTYCQDGWGIYDNTSELERAVACTDGYYGDSSSVVQLYQKIDKPILIQEIEYKIPKFDFGETLYFTDGVWKGDKIYFPAWNVNGIFSFDNITKQTKLMKWLPARLDTMYLFCKMEQIGKKLYLFPTNEEFILIFDIQAAAWDKVYIDDEKIGDSRARFTDAYSFDKVIWLKPYFSHAIVSYSIENGELEYYSEWYRELEKYISDDDTPKFGAGSKSEDAFYFPLVQANKVVEFNVYSRTYRIINIGNDDDCILNVRYYDNKLYCYTTHDDLLICSLSTNDINRKNGVFHQPVEAVGMVVKDGFMWIFACRKDMYAKVSMNDLSTEIVKDYCDGMDIGYPNPVIKDNVIYLYPNQAEYMFAVDTSSNVVKKITVSMPEEYRIDWEKEIVEQFPLREKNELTSLKKLIKRHDDELKAEVVKNNAGDDIYIEALGKVNAGREVR